MGGDGGNIPSRADMVRTKGFGSIQKASQGGMGYTPNYIAKVSEETLNSKEQRKLGMRLCAISQNPLTLPIVVCKRGYLYSKEHLIERLLIKSTNPLPEQFAHIKNLKDVKELNKPKRSANGNLLCPVTHDELDDGVTRCVFLWSCGCLVSQTASDLDKDSKRCPNCNESYQPDQVIEMLQPSTGAINVTKKRKLESLEERREKERKQKTADELSKYKDDESYRKLFNTNKVSRTDAFGREFSNKGVGI